MEEQIDFEAKTLKCKECENDFIWTPGEQKFFYEKGLKHKPTRCKDCRVKHRKQVESEFYKVTCASCGIIGDVMFTPKEERAKIYCKDCFDKKFLNQPSGI